MVQAIILVGGKGIRISRLYPDRPKALIPVAGIPFLEHQLAWLSQGGVRDIHLASGHMSEAIQEWLCPAEARSQKSEVRGQRLARHSQPSRGEGGSEISKKTDGIHGQLFRISKAIFFPFSSDLSLSFSAEPSPLGTGGGLKHVEKHIRSDPFLVLNGDSFLPHLDFAAFRQAHEQADPLASLAVTTIRETGRYGTIEFDPDRRISAFHEKAERQEGWVNGGAYLMDKKALAPFAVGKKISLETDIFPELAAQGQLRAFPVPPPLLDMGTPEGLSAMERYFEISSNNLDRS